jgi:hypothetical protein
LWLPDKSRHKLLHNRFLQVIVCTSGKLQQGAVG